MLTLPPVMAVLPPALVVMLVKGVVPTMPLKAVVPVVFTTRLLLPSTVVLKVMAALPVEANVRA